MTTALNYFGNDDSRSYLDAIALAAEASAHAATTADATHSDAEPESMRHSIDSVDLSQPLGTTAATIREVEALYLDHAVWFHHHGYAAHLNCPVTVSSLAAEVLISSVNSSMDTWDQSRAATLIEQRTINEALSWCGFGGEADGVFTPGGTTSNLQAMLLARGASRCADLSALRVFVTANTHFSIPKALAVLGLGPDAVVEVATDHRGAMCPASLAHALAAEVDEGRRPMAVVATAGTTDRGIIDPIADLATLCETYDTWLHVDAAVGGALLCSVPGRLRLTGIHRAQSVTIDFHKTFFVPIGTSALLVASGHHFEHVTWHADYLNPATSRYPNHVDKTLQTTRRFDALKVWMTLRQHGVDAIGDAFAACIERAEWAHDMADTMPDVQTLERPQLTMLLFRYAPAGLDESGVEAVNRAAREYLLRSGEAAIAATTVDGGYWLKLTLLNPGITRENLRAVLEHVRRAARKAATDGAAQELVA